jgi:hypothetical protein
MTTRATTARAGGATSAAEAKWAKRVARLERSGVSSRTFAAREGLKAGSVSYWKWRLSQRGRARPAAVAPLRFVELTGRQGPSAAPAPPAPGFEVVLATGRKVRVPGGFDAGELGRLVAVLEEVTP